MKERFVRFTNEETGKLKRSSDLDLRYYEKFPKADILVHVIKKYDDEDDLREFEEAGCVILKEEEFEEFLDAHEHESIVNIDTCYHENFHIEGEYDFYFSGVNCFYIDLSDEQLKQLTDDELRDEIEQQTPNDMGYDFDKYDAYVFDGEKVGEGLSEEPVARVEKVLKVVKRRES
jgi:hypothetical protein